MDCYISIGFLFFVRLRVMVPERAAGEGAVQNALEAQQEKDET